MLVQNEMPAEIIVLVILQNFAACWPSTTVSSNVNTGGTRSSCEGGCRMIQADFPQAAVVLLAAAAAGTNRASLKRVCYRSAWSTYTIVYRS